MSGTSMDGIDAALVEIGGSAENPQVHLRAFVTRPYPTEISERLMRVASGSAATTAEISELNFRLGELFADAAHEVCKRIPLSPSRLFVIGSHGQTVFHQGPTTVGPRLDSAASVDGSNAKQAGSNPGPPASTLQIASSAVIAERTGVPVVSDFRAADMAVGGEGAPLVPMADYLLLRDSREGTVALNIGGIANVTVIPAGARPVDVVGFDTGPGNMVIDALVRRATNGRAAYDFAGQRGRFGRLLVPVLEDALSYPFFSMSPPKSSGREHFGKEFVNRYFSGAAHVRPNDLIRTATELTARTITDALAHFLKSDKKMRRLVVSGGGAHNTALIHSLRELLPQLEILYSDAFGLPGDAKEAMAFALLADRTMHGLPGNLPSVTGARRAVILGSVTRP